MKAVRLYNEWKKYTFHLITFTFPFHFKMSVNWSVKVLICFRNSYVIGLAGPVALFAYLLGVHWGQHFPGMLTVTPGHGAHQTCWQPIILPLQEHSWQAPELKRLIHGLTFFEVQVSKMGRKKKNKKKKSTDMTLVFSCFWPNLMTKQQMGFPGCFILI